MILRQSFLTLPPDFFVVLKVTQRRPLTGREFAGIKARFFNNLQYLKKKAHADLSYHWQVEFSHCKPHLHLLLRSDLFKDSKQAKREIVRLWKKCCHGKRIEVCCQGNPKVYCEKVRNPTGTAIYIKKARLKYRVEMPPRMGWKRVCLTFTSRGFLAKSKTKLWDEIKKLRSTIHKYTHLGGKTRST